MYCLKCVVSKLDIILSTCNNTTIYHYASYLLLHCIIIYLELFQMVLLLLKFRLLRYYSIGVHSPTLTIESVYII